MATTINSSKFIQKAQIIVNNNLSNTNLNGAFIAQKLGLSRMHLHRKLKTYCNKNSSQFIKAYRIEYAKEALVQSHYSIQKIAMQSGFSSLPYFCKTFREITGVTPSQYRNYYC